MARHIGPLRRLSIYKTKPTSTLPSVLNGVGGESVDGTTQPYMLCWEIVIAEEVGNYLYDETGAPIGIQYRQKSDAAEVFSTYVFEKNLQGDIIAIYNESGTKIASYTYDAWGNFTLTYASGISATDRVAATNNPFTYRGYYFDSETDLYYLNSRYYNSNWGRFISSDIYLSTGQDITGYNTFAYCGNNPVMRSDDDGKFWNIVAGAVIGAAINIGVSALNSFLAGEEYTWKNALVDGLSGAVTGAFAATGFGAIVQASVGAATSFAGSVATDKLNGEEANWVRASNAAALGAFTGWLGGAGVRANTAVRKADSSCIKVLEKAASGGYKTLRGAKSAMTQAINRLNKALKPVVWETTVNFAKGAGLSVFGMYIYDRVNE